MQIATTQDYATDSWFWTVFTGALNHQTAHHLFPGVIQSHYMKITPIVKKTCEEFGVKYHYVDTTTEALGCHFNHLKVLGQGSKKHLNDWTITCWEDSIIINTSKLCLYYYPFAINGVIILV